MWLDPWLARLGIDPRSRTQRAHAIAMLVITIGAVVHHVALWYWYIEDAAISFAYSKHLAMGEGLVPFIGGERVEGYSNPAWVFFLAPFSLIFDLHAAAKWIQVLLCVPTVWITWYAAREAMGRENHFALAAPAVLAGSAQFAIWSGSGLEMSLMNFLMAAAVWRSLIEIRIGGWPWSALLWFGVTISRPEAILYAAVAGFCAMVFQLHARRGLVPTLQWLVTFYLPFGVYQAWRYSYFAWELPNTYYAKLERRPEFPLLDWAGKSWKYTRNFMHEVGWGFFLPIWVLGAMGHTRWRFPAAIAISLAMALAVDLGADQRYLLPIVVTALLGVFWLGLRMTEQNPPRWLAGAGLLVAVGLVAASELLRWGTEAEPIVLPTPEWVSTVPPYVLIGLGMLLPLLVVGHREWQARMLTWLLCCAAILFALIAQWDWMNGYRWYAPAVVPGALLFGFGVSSFAEIAQQSLSERRPMSVVGYAVAVVLVLATVPANVWHTVGIARKPQAEPRDVLQRVKYVDGVRDRLHVYERWVDLDVDQGAHLYWSDFEMLDIAGLVDVPLAHHKFERPFVQEYLFEEERPHFAHVHGGWATNSRIPSFKEFRSDYLEIPGYIANRTQFHIGNHVRRDLIVQNRWPHAPARVALEDGIVLQGVHVPSEPKAGDSVYVEVGVSSTKPRKNASDNFRMVMFAAGGGALHTWDVAPGYDWLFPEDWGGGEVFVGKLDLRLPQTLPPGTYDLGFVVMSERGTVLGPLDPTDVPTNVRVGGHDGLAPYLAHGEVVYRSPLVILDEASFEAAVQDDLAAAVAQADADRCEAGKRSWFLARMHRAGSEDFVSDHRDEVHRALAGCYARRADTLDDRADKVATLVRARELDHWAPDYRRRAKPLAEELYQEGLVARESADWEAAYRLFADAVDVDRSRSWARRYAEEARGYRLGIDEETLAKEQAEKEERREAARRRRQDLLEEREAQQAANDDGEPEGE